MSNGRSAQGVPKLVIRSPGLQVNKEIKKEQSKIIKEAAPNKRQSDDETVEENKMKKIEYVICDILNLLHLVLLHSLII